MLITLFVTFLTLQLLLLALDAWETRRLQRRRKNQPPPSRRTVIFLIGVTLVFLAIQLTGGWLVPKPQEILANVRHGLASWTTAGDAPLLGGWQAVVLGLVLFYTAGFWDYLVHRCFSHSRWFWFTHEYHHLPRQVTIWMPGILVRPFGFIPVAISTFATATAFYLALSLLGLPLWDLRPVLPALLIVSLVLTASHSRFLRRWPLVHRIMSCCFLTAPQEHLLHHAIDSRSNYGNFTTLWDRLLGTYESPVGRDLEQIPLGLSYDQDFLGTLTLGRVQLTPIQRDRYEVARYCNLKDELEAQ